MQATVKEAEREDRKEIENQEAEKKRQDDYIYLLNNKNAIIKEEITEFLKNQ